MDLQQLRKQAKDLVRYGAISPLDGAAGVDDPACLRLLLEHGATTEGTHAPAHALDYEPLEPVRLLLDAGADPNLIAHAVRRGRGPEAVRLLAERGGDVNGPGGETWRGDVPRRTPYQHAVLRSRDDVAAALRELGANTTVADEDLAVAAVARGEAARLPAAFDVDQQEVLILAALWGRLDAVVDAVGPDFAGVVGGSPEGTLLQHAAWDHPTSSGPCSSAAPIPWPAAVRSGGRRPARSTTSWPVATTSP